MYKINQNDWIKQLRAVRKRRDKEIAGFSCPPIYIYLPFPLQYSAHDGIAINSAADYSTLFSLVIRSLQGDSKILTPTSLYAP